MEHLQSDSSFGGQWDNPVPNNHDDLISTWNTTSIQENATAVVMNPTSVEGPNRDGLDVQVTRSTSLTPWNTNSESLNSAEDLYNESESDNGLSTTASKGKARRHNRNFNMAQDSGLYWRTKYETLKMAFDTLSNRIGSNAPPPIQQSNRSQLLPLDPGQIGTDVPPPLMMQPTNYPGLKFSPLDLNLTSMMDSRSGPSVDRPFVPLDLDYLAQEPVATGHIAPLNMEGSSSAADEQANPAFMNPLHILQFSQSIDSVSGTSTSAGPAIASASKNVRKSRRMRVGRSKTARNLCAGDWRLRNPNGTTEEFGQYFQNLSTEEKLRYKSLELEQKALALTVAGQGS